MEHIRKIAEIYAGIDQDMSSFTVEEVNKYLASGWILLAIHQRGFHDPTNLGGEQMAQYTFYILGHTDPEASEPS